MVNGVKPYKSTNKPNLVNKVDKQINISMQQKSNASSH